MTVKRDGRLYNFMHYLKNLFADICLFFLSLFAKLGAKMIMLSVYAQIDSELDKCLS